jgi:hypothetical protein
MSSLISTFCEQTVAIVLLSMLLLISEGLGSTDRTRHNTITSLLMERIRNLGLPTGGINNDESK